MARSEIVYLTDDFSGKADEGVETIPFMMEDGKQREIDLNPKNARIFRDKFKRYVEASRVVTAESKKRKGSKPVQRGLRTDSPEIRKWAAANGIPLNERGRIPKDVAEMYDSRNDPAPVVPGPSQDEYDAEGAARDEQDARVIALRAE